MACRMSITLCWLVPATLAGLLVLLMACTVGPNYVRPEAEIPGAYKEMEGWKVAQPKGHLTRGAWWKIFNDPQLNALEEQINISNQSLKLAEAQFWQARTLVQTVLTGFQEVEDNLAALRILEEEAKVQDEAVRAARQSVTVTTNEYRAGTVSYLNVIVFQTTALSNERTAVDILGRRMTAATLLIKALGGGWDVSTLRSADDLKGKDDSSKPAYRE
jgi:outer membrane protein TolC